MINKLLIISCVLALSIACGTSSEKKENLSENKEEKTETLHLDNGEKWISNVETHFGMDALRDILQETYQGINKDSLVVDIKNYTSFIISKCNMKGEAHDQLHLVLVPILHATDELKKAKTDEEIEQALAVIEKNLVDYFEYFKAKEGAYFPESDSI